MAVKEGKHDSILKIPEIVSTVTKTTTIVAEAEPVLESPQILFYDPEELPFTKAGDTPAVPPRVYDKEGNEVDLNGGDYEIVRPKRHSEDQDDSDDVEEDEVSYSYCGLGD